MRHINLYIILSVLIGVSGCSGDRPVAPDAPVSSLCVIPMTEPGGDDAPDGVIPDPLPGLVDSDNGGDGAIADPSAQKGRTVENCRLVQAAAEAFAARNNGWHPANLLDTNLDGLTLTDLLPGGQPLVNPVTGVRNLPVDGAASNPGETGYLGLWEGRAIKGYWITGAGRTGRMADIKKSVFGDITESVGRLAPTLDDMVLENCLAVLAAADAYMVANGGVYPGKVEDFISYLPGSTPLSNPSTGTPTEPVDWKPSGLGSASYNSLRDFDEHWNASLVGCRVVGRGEHGDVVISNTPVVINKEQTVVKNTLVVRAAVEAFAADNGGEYPYNNGDVNPLGNTVQDYLPDSRLLENPFTGVPTEPVWGAAAAQIGQTGFVATVCGPAPGGYLISGIGASNYIEIYTIEKPCTP